MNDDEPTSRIGAARPPVMRLTTAAVEARHRAQLVGDVMARQLCGGDVATDGGALWCDWTLAEVAPGMVVGDALQGGLVATRDGALLADGDDDVSIFIARRGAGRVEQNDRRVELAPGEAVIVAHARGVRSWWPDNDVRVLRVPRTAVDTPDLIATAGGVRLAADSPALALLASYVDTAASLARAAPPPPIVGRHLGELASLVLAEAGRRDAGTRRRGPAAQAARVAAIREVIARRSREPGLTMAAVAAAAGLSERAGYLAFAAAGISFTDLLMGTRLDRAHEALAAGYAGKLVDLAFAVGFADLSHFNRRFRARFGMTPGDARVAVG